MDTERMMVRRYEPYSDNSGWCMTDSDTGSFVDFEDYQRLTDYVAGLERALSEYVVLGAGKCTISKAHADMGRAALAAKP